VIRGNIAFLLLFSFFISSTKEEEEDRTKAPSIIPFNDSMVARGVPAMAAVAIAALDLTGSSNWWRDINRSPLWQDWIFHLLSILYGIVAAVALVRRRFCQISISTSIRVSFPIIYNNFNIRMNLGLISSNTIESAGVWLDHAKGLSLS